MRRVRTILSGRGARLTLIRRGSIDGCRLGLIGFFLAIGLLLPDDDGLIRGCLQLISLRTINEQFRHPTLFLVVG